MHLSYYRIYQELPFGLSGTTVILRCMLRLCTTMRGMKSLGASAEAAATLMLENGKFRNNFYL